MFNAEIRKRIEDAELKYWQVAYEVGVSESTLCIWLRKPLTGERKARIDAAISSLIAQRKEAAI